MTEEEVRRIYDDTIDALYGYVSRRCGGDRELAEDITQEAWLRAVRDWARKGIPREPIAWLTRVARNVLLNHLRRKGTVQIESVSARDILAAVDENSVNDSAEIAAAVGSAMSRLPLAQAGLLEAFHFEQRKVGQIAESLGMTERAVEGRLRRARENLRKHLEADLKANGGFI
jgi:RNA polymerase sigma-70 factor (ECF subfamily)